MAFFTITFIIDLRHLVMCTGSAVIQCPPVHAALPGAQMLCS